MWSLSNWNSVVAFSAAAAPTNTCNLKMFFHLIFHYSVITILLFKTAVNIYQLCFYLPANTRAPESGIRWKTTLRCFSVSYNHKYILCINTSDKTQEKMKIWSLTCETYSINTASINQQAELRYDIRSINCIFLANSVASWEIARYFNPY